MDDAKTVIGLGNKLFSDKATLDSLWQEVAEQFYPERANFTYTRDLGDEFASHLMTSAPVLARRDLADSLSSMLRRGRWFKLRAAREEWENHEAREWLDYAGDVQFRIMEDRRAKFQRAAKLADNDFSTFGQCVMQITMNGDLDGLLYQTWHLKDCAWQENVSGDVDTIHRKWKPRIDQLIEKFGKKPGATLHPKILQAWEGGHKQGRHREIECRHVVMPDPEGRRKYVSLHIDVENEHVMEAIPMDRFEYIVPRWAHSGSQYAHSPAVMVALPDARLIQAITLTLLEAGERYVNPPMVATDNVVRSDVQLFAGGITWVDQDYDERLGQALRPITQDKGAFPVAFNIRDDINLAMKEAFYLNKISLPPMQGHQMTATETRERVQEYIRQALPLFEPMEDEYNLALCDSTFELIMQFGGFGPMDTLPEALRGKEVKFQFETPLQAAEDAEKTAQFQEVLGLLQQAVQADTTLAAELDFHEAFKDALIGLGAPTDWTVSEREKAQRVAEMQAQSEMQQDLETAQQVAGVLG